MKFTVSTRALTAVRTTLFHGDARCFGAHLSRLQQEIRERTPTMTFFGERVTIRLFDVQAEADCRLAAKAVFSSFARFYLQLLLVSSSVSAGGRHAFHEGALGAHI